MVLACASALALALGIGPVRAADQSPGAAAEMFAQREIDEGYAILNNASLTAAQRHAQFSDFMKSLTDFRRIGLFTLGPYANRASKEQIDEFIGAFTDYAIAVYEMRLGQYKGQTLKVTGSVVRSEDDVIVNADVVNPATPNAPPYKASFRVRKDSSGRFIVTDLQVEGIWLVLSQRSDFTGFLQQHNGRMGDLITDLKRQTEMLLANEVQTSAR